MTSAAFRLKGSEFKTNWPLLILIVVMPLRNIQLQYIPNLGGGLNFINVFFFLALGHALIYGKKVDIKPPINTFLIWFILSSIIALFFGYGFLGPSSYGDWKSLKDSLIPVLLVFVIQRSALDDIQWRRIFIATLVPLPYCFKVVWSQYRSVASWHYSDDLRIRGTFMDLGANEMGAFSVTMALVCIGCLIACWPNKKWRYVMALCTVFSSICVLYSYSRGGYIAFLFGFLFIVYRFRNRKKLFMPIFLALLIGLANLPESVVERFSSIDANEEERDESAQSRFVFWAIAFDKFLERPIFGYGYHTAQDKRINPHEMDTHNYYVKMLVERGLVGFITFIVLLRLLANLMRRNLNWKKHDYISYGLTLGMSGAIPALALGNMFGDRFSHYPISTCLWVFVGLVSVIEAKRIKEENDFKKANYAY